MQRDAPSGCTPLMTDPTMITSTPSAWEPTPKQARAAWRGVAIPTEHGGWGLTAEPVLLGLLVAPSWAGIALGAGAFVAFTLRTPLKIMLVDRWRHRQLARTALATRFASTEVAVLAAITIFAFTRAGWTWLAPIAVAAPLVGLELWFDMRSRSRRLVPELCGALGMAAAAASIAIAGGSGARLAIGLWLVLAARSVATIPFVRVQIDRLRHGASAVAASDRAQLLGLLTAAAAAAVTVSVLAGTLAVAALSVAHGVWVRRPPVPAKVLGVRQLLLGFAIVAIAALGVHV